MPRRLDPIDESLSGELWDYFLDFIEVKGGIPLERSFWCWLIGHGKYSSAELPEHKFRYHFGRLYREGYIAIDRDTRCLIPLRNCKVMVMK